MRISNSFGNLLKSNLKIDYIGKSPTITNGDRYLRILDNFNFFVSSKDKYPYGILEENIKSINTLNLLYPIYLDISEKVRDNMKENNMTAMETYRDKSFISYVSAHIKINDIYFRPLQNSIILYLISTGISDINSLDYRLINKYIIEVTRYTVSNGLSINEDIFMSIVNESFKSF
jgi:hypothetical protein